MSKAVFNAPLLLKTGHLQTAYSGLVWQPPGLKSDQQYLIPVAEGIQLKCLLNWAGPQAGHKLWILVHGLESSADAAYMVSTARKGINQGWDVLRMNIRGCGGSAHLSHTAYHAGLSDDVLAVAQYAAKVLGYREIVLAGFSLGGHQVLKLATELTSVPTWLKGICAISPPLDLGLTSRNLIRLENRGYERYFFKQMVQTYRLRLRLWPDHTPKVPLEKIKNLYDFDEYVTSACFGFRDAQDYYAQTSVGPRLDHLLLPVQIIIAKDDPIIPFGTHKPVMVRAFKNLEWLVSPGGGHVGFINSAQAAKNDLDCYWAENRLLDFANQVLI
jgi:uncharacterized protein